MQVRFFSVRIVILCSILWIGCSSPETWRSSLYPKDWSPGYMDEEGRFLHDFSYAGYHSGMKEIPAIKENIIDITRSPYNADNKNGSDVTEILQQAINDAGAQGGGVVYLPEGEYIISVKERYGLLIDRNNVIIRGAGENKTFIKNVTNEMRNKTVISFQKPGRWSRPVSEPIKLTKDIGLPTTLVAVENTEGLRVGDLIVLYADCTEEFIEEYNASHIWNTRLAGPTFCRTITDVDVVNKQIEIDVPTRYSLKLRDNARLYLIGEQLMECGIEYLTVGNVQSFAPGDVKNENEYQNAGTMGYAVHASHFIVFQNAMNCWARNINTFCPEENRDDVHVLSNGIRLSESRFMTVADCSFGFPQYEGGGGNGYMFTIESNDCLLSDCHAEHARHNYDFKRMCSNGNVIHGCIGKDSYYASDFHMYLSMANLIDCTIMDGDFWDASFRPYGGGHGYTTSQTVFWNTVSKKEHDVSKFLIDSKQHGWGYVIGTSGVLPTVVTAPAIGIKNNTDYDTAPEDFVEGEGLGEALNPQSLYLDQLQKRKRRE
ncbi:glycoside hydrolase family 55 protein [Parabacteroides sp. OttesenSCG-928-G07]|nr:glycoside hydrolase family 55 protein [Parabacteroides sp. OttesenSCG-928-G07]